MSDPSDTFREEPAPADDADAIIIEANGDLLTAFRDEVHRRRVTTYVLLLRNVVARLDGTQFGLFFATGERQAYTYANQPDNLAVLREAARALHGQHTVLKLQLGDSAVADEKLESASGPSGAGPQPSPIIPATDSSGSSGQADRPATVDDVVRLFGARE